MSLSLTVRKAIADLINEGELKLDDKTEKYRGKYAHSATTMQYLLKEGYAGMKGKDNRGKIVSIIPTIKAVNSIHVWM